jgi:hypothetical protein
MLAYHDLRVFYNQAIHPELLHLEQRRRRLVRLLFVSALLLAGVFLLQLFLEELLFTLLLLIPVGLWISYLAFRVRQYYLEFKPRIVHLLLDFIDNNVNFKFTDYAPKGIIPRSKFIESRIFVSADEYAAEDLIRGQVRETPFEVCELRVREFSPARTRLDYVFRGIFLVGDFRRWDMRAMVLVLPDTYRKYLSRSERAFHLAGGRRVQTNLLPEFEALFDTYATPETKLHEVLSEEFQRAILEFRRRFQQMNREKEIYFSIVRDKIYLALTQDKNLLEPSLFASNASYEKVREFYDDLMLLLELVLMVDVMN